MTATLYLFNNLTRSIVPIPGNDYVQELKRAVDEAIENEQELEEMRTDIHIDLQNAIRERRRLQRMLWEAS